MFVTQISQCANEILHSTRDFPRADDMDFVGDDKFLTQFRELVDGYVRSKL